MIPTKILIHHSASSRDNTTVKNIDDWHKLRWPGFISSLGYHVGYHYVIEGSGKITQTREDNEIGAHSPPNDGKIGICLTGNFMSEKPSEAQLKALEAITDQLKEKYSISYVEGHREFQNTECPGDELFKWVLNRKVSWIILLIKRLFGIELNRNLWK